MNANGIRRGKGIVRKRMDERIAKKDTARRGTRSVMPWVFCTLRDLASGASTISFFMRGESSHRSRSIKVEGSSRVARGGERDAGDSPEPDQEKRER